MRWPLRALWAIALLLVLAAVWVYLATTGFWGQRQPRGDITPAARDAGFVRDKTQRQSGADALQGADVPEKRILFGDLHVHSTYSFDAYNASLPMYRGDGSHPPGDACDFARFCSGLDFWSINDHAEGLTARQWQLTRDMVSQCNATAGDPTHPDMVTFLSRYTATHTDNNARLFIFQCFPTT